MHVTLKGCSKKYGFLTNVQEIGLEEGADANGNGLLRNARR